MRRFISKNRVVLALGLLAVAQLVVLGFRLESRDASGSWFQVGDTLSGIRAFDSSGQEASLVGGDPTVVLVFHSECGHCEDVAPLWRDWRDWTTASGSDFRTVAISSEPLKSAKAYAAQHEWDAEVWTVEAGGLGGLGHGLTGRTPWIFVLDEMGVILAEGHGRRIVELVAVLGAETQEVSGT